MIGRVLKRGHKPANLLYYLYKTGEGCAHVRPHLVGGWRHPAELEPPVRPGGHRDFRRLTGLLKMPLALLGGRAPREFVYHLALRAAPGDPDLGDGAWMAVCGEIMHRLGLSEHGREDEGVPWVAVHHGDNHVHIVAVLARLDGRRAVLDNDFYTIGAVLRDVEAEYGLVRVDRPDRTAAVRPTRGETEKAARAGRAEPPRVTLRRTAAAAAAAARDEAAFFAGLEQRGLKVRLRHSTTRPGQVTGYAVALPGDLTAGGGQIWYSGRKLAPDLSLPKLRARWAAPGPDDSTGPDLRPPARGRLSGTAMTDGASRAVLRREVARAAAAARDEAGFFAGLRTAGILTRIRPGNAPDALPGMPAPAAGYAVSLPGMVHYKDGNQVWYGGQTLDPALSLPALRRRWRAGQPGTPPGPAMFAGQDAADIYRYAAIAAAEAARQLRSPGADGAADVAWAAADLIAAAAEATGNAELQKTADWFARAGRAPWGRIPAPTPGGLMLRTAAHLLAGCHPGGWNRRVARAGLRTALSGLARSLAGLRAEQARLLQAAAAREAAAGLAAAGIDEWAAPVPGRAAARGSSGPGAPAGRRRPGPAPGPAAARAGPGQ